MTQPQQSTLARKWKWEINTGTVPVPVWTVVKGLAEFTPGDPVGNLEEDNVYEDEGYTSSTKTSIGWSLSSTIMRRTSPDDITTYDPGQEKLRALSGVMGPAGVAHVRWYDRDGGPEAYEGFAEVVWENQGGPSSALESINVTLTGKGPRTAITNPNALAVPTPTVTAVSPTGGGTAGGTLVKITGSGFIHNGVVVVSGATGVKFGANNATAYMVADSQTIYATAPAGSAATIAVRVTNSTGQSADTAADNYTYA